MGFFESAQEALDRGVSAAKGAVSGVAVEQQAFVKAFVRLCADGWVQGWHERNGGNLSYRMTPEDVSSCRPFFYDAPSSWVPLGLAVEELAGEFFLVTASGSHMRTIASNPVGSIGIVELDSAGASWRTVWGFKGGRMPSSEFPSHAAIHAVRSAATEGASRVLYHAHPENIVALSAVMPADARVITRALWKAMTEAIIAFPQGVGALPWMVPGGAEIAEATAEVMKRHPACVWAQHGLFCAGADFDEAFGLMQTVEKSAAIHVKARLLNGGADFPCTIPDEGLRAIAATYRLPVNEAFLD